MGMYLIRETKIININEVESIEKLKESELINLVVEYNINNRTISFDVGSWCYSDVSKKGRRSKVRPVNLKSLKMRELLQSRKYC
ncbi:hypothetical protein ACNPMZ_12065 [Acinetobacter pittii]|uniref:hypothetical protein n=1 Tax=Acinetobacter pittii TaxID=48296 RepID=UPI003AA89275